MFRNRKGSNKPDQELLANFRSSYGPSMSTASRLPGSSAPESAGPSLDALDVATNFPPRHFDHADDIKDPDPTPRGLYHPDRFTPSALLDPNSNAFHMFANQLPGYYTPTPNGTNTIYHSQAGDLHTPGFGLNVGTPLSMPNTESSLHAAQTSGPPMPVFHSSTLAPHIFQNAHAFHDINPQQTFAPQQFYHQPGAFDSLGPTIEESPLESMHGDIDMLEHSPTMNFHPQAYRTHVPQPAPEEALQNFRWHTTLNAPTAMTKDADEIPITYLNKGQAYTLNIKDSAPLQVSSTFNKYRTFVRISFEDDQQRQKPAACWQLWKEGRGTNEAHQRGGRLQAVEFVESSQGGGGGADISGRPHIDLESFSFDGFAVTWTPGVNQPPQCSLAVRFNFLSTDFSHSKGVKGIPVRLCVKTELLSAQQPLLDGDEERTSEICYSKVKLFRDHGAERKLTNDTAHVKKMIEKIKTQIQQVEQGVKDPGKRRRSGSMIKSPVSSTKPGKVSKARRSWAEAGGPYSSGDNDDLQAKLHGYEMMLISSHTSSILFLKGEELDDPDLHPVRLGGEPPELIKHDSGNAAPWEKQSAAGESSISSPTPSSMSMTSGGRQESAFQQTLSRISSNEWHNLPGQTATGDIISATSQQVSSPSLSKKIIKPDPDGSGLEFVEAIDVDSSYQPPPERAIKPVACYYVQPRVGSKSPKDSFYRAVYIMQHTVKDVVSGIATKCDIEPTKVIGLFRHHATMNIDIALDNDAIREIPEGQAMLAEFRPLRERAPISRQWDAGSTDVHVDGDMSTIANVTTSGYELWLSY